MNTLEQFSNEIDKRKPRVELRDAILRLSENPDFKLVIRERFLVEDCARFVRESISLELPPENRADALGFAQAAGYLKQWLNKNIQLGDVAAEETKSYCDAMDEIRMNGEDEDEIGEG